MYFEEELDYTLDRPKVNFDIFVFQKLNLYFEDQLDYALDHTNLIQHLI